MFNRGELVRTGEQFDGMSLWDNEGNKAVDRKMDSSRLYLVIDDSMMSTRTVMESCGKVYSLFLEYLRGA